VKKAPVYIAIILCLCTAGLYSAEITDTIDTTKIQEKKNKGFGLELIAIAGGGMATGSNYDYWSENFHDCPAFAIGIEVPFSKTHYVSVEIYEHLWSAKAYNPNTDYPKTDYRTVYTKGSNNRYSQYGTSAVLKAYIFSPNSPIRISFHTGFMAFGSSKDYIAIDIGCALYVRLNENLALSLNRRILFSIPNPGGGGGSPAPNFLMLNLQYKFKL
jgi:hypothetical protein